MLSSGYRAIGDLNHALLTRVEHPRRASVRRLRAVLELPLPSATRLATSAAGLTPRSAT